MSENVRLEDQVAAVALLDEPSRRRLYELVASSGDAVGRDAAAGALGISRELAAFHLDRLVAGGLLETEFRRLGNRRGPGAGRPAKLYRRSERELLVSLPARHYERAADLMAEALAGHGSSGAEALASVARARGEEAGREARRTLGSRPGRGRLRAALLDHLRGAGYEPADEVDAGTICLLNCPYRALAASHRDLTCGMSLAWAAGLVLGIGEVGLRAELARTPGHCCVVLREGGADGGASAVAAGGAGPPAS